MERSMSMRGASSKRLGRSDSTLVRSEYASSKCEKATRYERLSQSMRVSSESIELDGHCGDDGAGGGMERARDVVRTKSRARRLFDKMFSRKKIDINEQMKLGEMVEDDPNEKISKKSKKNKDKQTSSWRSDTLKRWPVQGW